MWWAYIVVKLASPERDKMKNLNLNKIGTAVALLGASAVARADAGTDAITALGPVASTYIAAAFGVAILVAGGFWGIKMMKKAFGAAK